MALSKRLISTKTAIVVRANDWTDARNRFQSFHRIAPLACAVTETEVERADSLGGLTP